MSHDSHATVLYSEENLDAEHFTNILKGIGLSKAETKKTKDEHRCLCALMSDSKDEMMWNLRPTCNRKITQHLNFVRLCTEFDRASIHDIENLTISPSK